MRYWVFALVVVALSDTFVTISTSQAAAGNGSRAVATPVRWGRGIFGTRTYDGRPNGSSSQATRDFYRGIYGSRTFSYGGVNARPGYAPGPP